MSSVTQKEERLQPLIEMIPIATAAEAGFTLGSMRHG
jgi:hypothetical protein